MAVPNSTRTNQFNGPLHWDPLTGRKGCQHVHLPWKLDSSANLWKNPTIRKVGKVTFHKSRFGGQIWFKKCVCVLSCFYILVPFFSWDFFCHTVRFQWFSTQDFRMKCPVFHQLRKKSRSLDQGVQGVINGSSSILFRNDFPDFLNRTKTAISFRKASAVRPIPWDCYIYEKITIKVDPRDAIGVIGFVVFFRMCCSASNGTIWICGHNSIDPVQSRNFPTNHILFTPCWAGLVHNTWKY